MKSSAQIRAEIEAQPAEARLAFVRLNAAKLAVDRLERDAKNALLLHRGAEDLDHVGNNVGHVISFAQSNAGRDLAAASAVLRVIEGDPEVQAAQAVLCPLHAELAEAVGREEAEARQEREALAALDDAERAAREKLAAKVQSDPNVVKARQALAGIKRLGQPLAPEAEDIGRELLADHH